MAARVPAPPAAAARTCEGRAGPYEGAEMKSSHTPFVCIFHSLFCCTACALWKTKPIFAVAPKTDTQRQTETQKRRQGTVAHTVQDGRKPKPRDLVWVVEAGNRGKTPGIIEPETGGKRKKEGRLRCTTIAYVFGAVHEKSGGKGKEGRKEGRKEGWLAGWLE